MHAPLEEKTDSGRTSLVQGWEQGDERRQLPVASDVHKRLVHTPLPQHHLQPLRLREHVHPVKAAQPGLPLPSCCAVDGPLHAP